MSKKCCFVVMGFGIKTDLATGRKLNLDKSYLALIKPVIEAKGIDCIRADEIKHSGTIDVPMYRQLLQADIVVADLSTANVNAFYELGIRHALCPRTTIIISEEQMSYPFDLNHILINKYTHLGEHIDYFEVMRFQQLLGETIDAVLSGDKQEPDSPVYTFIPGLRPPKMDVFTHNNTPDTHKEKPDKTSIATPNPSLSLLINQAEEALKQKQFAVANALFQSALLIAGSNAGQQISSNNSYLIHRLAYTTYKAELPNRIAASKEALELLAQLDLKHTNDAETVVLAGRIEKKLYYYKEGEAHLSRAILYFERACYLLNNRYNTINLAFLLNLRVDTSIYLTRLEKIADMVLANRIRRQVLSLCEQDLATMRQRRQDVAAVDIQESRALRASQTADDEAQLFWIWVNKAEAHFGLGEMEDYEAARAEAAQVPHEGWMMEVFDEQVARLRIVLQKWEGLLTE